MMKYGTTTEQYQANNKVIITACF